ncbi:MAG: uracil-DNA glycosylase [Zoogloeaceae bacterium]|jgi:DNA polymerase|nr:uracil-DNA glycosylase [Zoogloeaceae bacterium]
MEEQQAIILREMGYRLWRLRRNAGETRECPEETPVPAAKPVETPARPAAAQPLVSAAAPRPAAPGAANDERAATIASLDWEALTQAIQECRACGLCARRRQVVPGIGDRTANWLFVGEGPGAEEDTRGEPFVGQAGKLLDNMLAAIGLRRGHDVYIANAVKCRPEGNRTPSAEEMAACRPFLLRQIALIAPRLIVLMGKSAVHSVLGDDRSLAALRRKPLFFGETPAVVTYHPAYLLRNLPEKAKAWEDLCGARQIIRERENGGAA